MKFNTLLDIVSDDGKSDGYISGIDYEKLSSFLGITLLAIFFLSILVAFFIYVYINSRKTKTKELQKNEEEKNAKIEQQ